MTNDFDRARQLIQDAYRKLEEGTRIIQVSKEVLNSQPVSRIKIQTRGGKIIVIHENTK